MNDDDEQVEQETDVQPANVVRFGRPEVVAANDEKQPQAINQLSIPRDYVIVDVDNTEWYGTGFLVFTDVHVAVMKMLEGGGAVPTVVLPISRVKAAELFDDDDQ